MAKSFPDLNNDGEVTQADILKGRGVYKKGGVVKSLEKAGFYAKGKTKAEREKIVSQATTKPQRIGMVEKMFSAKKMKAGGMASKRADGIAIRGRTRA